jgi:small subunit ribosomal protein S1
MTLRQHDKRKYQINTMPEIDEGWWESVLAEEQQFATSRASILVAKPNSVPLERPEKSEPLSSALSEIQVNWDTARKLYADDSILELKVTGHNHGGLLVESDQLAGFVPFSHLVDLAGREIESDRDDCLEAYTGKKIKVKMIECVPEDGRVVFSERAALTPPGKRSELFHSLQIGDHVIGKVTNITDFGVFVDLGGVEGLIHLSELSWGRVSHPKQLVHVGNEIKVQVLDISVERSRVALSLKRLIPNPWTRAEVEFPAGRILSATITSILSYGAFARLDTGVEGLIHASEMPLQDNQSPRNLLTEGQQIQIRVLHVDPAHQRLGLSMKTTSE